MGKIRLCFLIFPFYSILAFIPFDTLCDSFCLFAYFTENGASFNWFAVGAFKYCNIVNYIFLTTLQHKYPSVKKEVKEAAGSRFECDIKSHHLRLDDGVQRLCSHESFIYCYQDGNYPSIR
jgi:hypothetical protein